MRPGRTNLELLFPLKDCDVTTGKLATHQRHEIGRVTFFLSNCALQQGQHSRRKKISGNVPYHPGAIGFLEGLFKKALRKMTFDLTGVSQELFFLRRRFGFSFGRGPLLTGSFFLSRSFLHSRGFFHSRDFLSFDFALFRSSFFSRALFCGRVLGSGSFFCRCFFCSWSLFGFLFLSNSFGGHFFSDYLFFPSANLPLDDNFHTLQPGFDRFLAMLHADLGLVVVE